MKRMLLLAALALVTAACSEGAVRSDAPPAASGSPTETPASPGTSPSHGTTQVTIYYLVAGAKELHLAPERHTVARTRAIARAALEELVHGTAQDPDHTTPFPRAAKINAVTIADKVATVDWSAEVLTPATGGAETEALGIQSIVYTLTEFASVDKVRFTVEGKSSGTASNGRAIEDFWGHVGLAGQPWDRDPQIEVLAPIALWTPLDGAGSSGTLRLSGDASVFEGNVGIILRDATGKVVKQTSAQTIGAPARGAFTATITFEPPSTVQTWTLQVIEDSAEDGSVLFMEDRDIRVG